MLFTLLVILTLAVLYWFPIRRWMSRWGTTPSDLARAMVGDGLLVNPTYSGTMAVIVSAPPEHIGPWLMQIRYQRGGLYSYEIKFVPQPLKREFDLCPVSGLASTISVIPSRRF